MEEKLKEEIEQLRIKLLHVEARQAATSKSTPPVYIKSERKLPKLAGRPVKDSDPDVEDWVTDMRDHIVNIPTNDEKIEFVLDHLTGNAKTEIRMRPSDMKKTADDILKIVEETFKIQDNLAQLRHKFYEREQTENESLETYSLSLMKLMHSINKKEGGDSSNNEKILTEKFIDGVRDYQLKRELRRFSMENPSMPFIEFRGRGLLWVDDRQPNSSKSAASINKVSIEETTPEFQSNDILEVIKKQQELLEKQQKQIDFLTQMVPRQQFHYRGRGIHSDRGRSRGRGYRRSLGRSNTITCYHCHEEGHKKPDCPKLSATARKISLDDPKAQPSQ